jgi:hypothetical protein
LSTEKWLFLFAGIAAFANFMNILKAFGISGMKEDIKPITPGKKKVIWTVTLSLLTIGLCGYGFYRVNELENTLRLPIADTPSGNAFAYKTLIVVNRRNFHDETIEVDGKEFLDCTIGPNAILSYSGYAPFKLVQSKIIGPIGFSSHNLSVNQALQFFHDTGMNPAANFEITAPNTENK